MANPFERYEPLIPSFDLNLPIGTTIGVNSKQVNLPGVTITGSVKQARSNRLKLASLKNKAIATLQNSLYKIGAFKGVKDSHGKLATFHTSVDGQMGGMTRQAIANARNMGYDVDEKTGNVTKKLQPLKQQQQPLPVKNPRIATSMGGYMPAQVQEQASLANRPSLYDQLLNKYLDNLYPYGYTLQRSERDKNYSPNPIFDKLFGSDASGVINKIIQGFKGKTDAKKAMDEFVDLDLNDPVQRKRAQELKNTYFSNFGNSSLEHIQLSARSRYDANALYTNHPLKYNTWMINPDYESPTAKEAGVPTYTYRDPELRKLLLEIARRHAKRKGPGLHSVVGDRTTTFNNYSVNNMHDDGSGRYVEKWDFPIDLGRTVIIGDTIPAK